MQKAIFLIFLTLICVNSQTNSDFNTTADKGVPGVIFCANKRDHFCEPYGLCCAKEVYSILDQSIVSYYCDDPSTFDARITKNLKIDPKYELYCAWGSKLMMNLGIIMVLIGGYMTLI